MQINQSPIHILAVRYLDKAGPPSSPPIKILLQVKIKKQMREQTKKRPTVNPNLPAGTSQEVLCLDAYMALITQGRPSPKNTFTEFDPVTLPTAESAYSDDLAAVILANVSGTDVPMATIVIAVIYGWSPTTHPIASATSPTIPVMTPINPRAIIKAHFPPPHFIGGTIAKNNFQKTNKNQKIESDNVTSVTIKSSSSIYGPRIKAFLNCYGQVGSQVDK